MKDAIYYEKRFFVRLQELFSEHAQKQILITERAEIYYFMMYGKYKMYIRRNRKNYSVCGQNIEDINRHELFDKIEVLEVRQYYNTYFKGTFTEAKDFYDKTLERMYKNGLLIPTRTRNKRQARKADKS